MTDNEEKTTGPIFGRSSNIATQTGGNPSVQPIVPPTPEAKPNVALGVRGTALAEGPLMIGPIKIEIPSEEQQRAGFNIDERNVSVLIGQFPQFKRFRVLKKTEE